MLGNNYYRCGEKNYYFSMNQNIEIYYSFKNKNGTPNESNDTRDKIKRHPAFLSPYTLWSIQLEKGNFTKLAKYSDDVINLELLYMAIANI